MPHFPADPLPQSRVGSVLEYHVTRLPLAVWSEVLSKERVVVLRQLKNWGFWRELPARGRSGALLIPEFLPFSGRLGLLTHIGPSRRRCCVFIA